MTENSIHSGYINHILSGESAINGGEYGSSFWPGKINWPKNKTAEQITGALHPTGGEEGCKVS